MTIYSFITSTIVAILLGYAYGLSFLLAKKKAFLFHPSTTQKRYIAVSLLLTLMRVGTLAVILFYLLRYSTLNVMLILALFSITFWTVIIKKKV